MIPFTFCNDILSMIIDGKIHTVTPEHVSFGMIKRALRNNEDEKVIKLLDMGRAIEEFVNEGGQGKVFMKDGEVYYNNVVVHSSLVDHIKKMMYENFPFKHLLRFLDHLHNNPSYKSRQELWGFIQNHGLHITEDGCFLAYKAIRNNWTDKWTGLINNSVGQIVKVDRSQVNDDHNVHCSIGLHVGGLDYVTTYGNHSSGDRIIIVKVDPVNAVSVPTDANFLKLRVCEYEVLREYEDPLDKMVYTDEGEDLEEDPWGSWYDTDIELDDEDLEDDDWENFDKKYVEHMDKYNVKNHTNCPCKTNTDGYYNKRDSKGKFCR